MADGSSIEAAAKALIGQLARTLADPHAPARAKLWAADVVLTKAAPGVASSG